MHLLQWIFWLFRLVNAFTSDLQSIALTTRPPRQLWNMSKVRQFFLAENVLNALLCAAWDNGVSEWVSQSVSDSRALVIRYHRRLYVSNAGSPCWQCPPCLNVHLFICWRPSVCSVALSHPPRLVLFCLFFVIWYKAHYSTQQMLRCWPHQNQKHFLNT